LFVSLNKILVLFLELFVTEQIIKDTHVLLLPLQAEANIPASSYSEWKKKLS
jgi:hypothetical protein